MRLVEFIRAPGPAVTVWINPDHVESVTPHDDGGSIIRYAGVNDAVVTVTDNARSAALRLSSGNVNEMIR